MATIIVEDGTGKTNSNSYVSEAEFATFNSDRGITLTADNGTASEVLVKANDYLETLYYIGTKSTEAQALQWPRDNVYIDGYYIESTTIPTQLKNGQMFVAVSIDLGEDPLTTLDRVIKKEKLDSLEIEYADNAASRAIITSAERTLQKLLCAGNNGSSFRVIRS